MASSIPGELISLPSSGSIPELPHVAETSQEGSRNFKQLKLGRKIALI
jgi:hypothetical protein